MNIEELRDEMIRTQKKGLPFICASVVLWSLIAVVAVLDIQIDVKNILVFCCAAPLMPVAWIFGKALKVDIFEKGNPLIKLAVLFNMNQILYLLIVMWVFNAVPEQMIMVFAMVFGAHLLPFSWVYKSRGYQIFSIVIPVVSLILGNLFNGFAVAGTVAVLELIFVAVLFAEMRSFDKKK
ncbi:DUF7010 family protein [Alloscardovia criceti]|uniref:DUF7010 family protein n=1 Tax=Alloscardovia criceti TaxID=356828 RepID=UPI0003A0E6D1|nr:hypothetical protein [Alloscardovia criceti]